MTEELKTSYWKKVNGDKEYVKIEDQLMNELPGYFGENPEIVVIRIGDAIFGDSGVTGIVVTTWVRTNVDWVKEKLDEILGGLEDF